MASGAFPGDGRYVHDLGTGRSGGSVRGVSWVTKTAGGGFWTGNPQPWSKSIGGASWSGTWTYDFRASTPQTITVSDHWASVGSGNIGVGASVTMDSGFGTVSLSENVFVPSPPATPGTPTASEITATSVRISWVIPSNGGAAIDQMLLRRFTTSDGTGAYVDYPQGGGTSTVVVGGLTPGVTYYWAVFAHNEMGYSGGSGLRGAQQLASSPGAPTDLAVSATPPSTINASWTAPTATGGKPLSGYDLQAALDAGFTTGVINATAAAAATSGSIPGANPGGTYYVRVRAKNVDAVSSWTSAATVLVPAGGKVWDGTTWKTGLAKVWDGTQWKIGRVKVWDGTQWKPAK